jgi:hypothetical protein
MRRPWGPCTYGVYLGVNAKKLRSPVILVFNIVQAFTRSFFILLGVNASGAAVARRITGVNARNANNFGMVLVF